MLERIMEEYHRAFAPGFDEKRYIEESQSIRRVAKSRYRFRENIRHGEPRRHCVDASDRQVLLAALPPGEARH
jgi:hypothetical protein